MLTYLSNYHSYTDSLLPFFPQFYSSTGRPICLAGKEMMSDGRDYARQCHKFRCPLYGHKHKSYSFQNTCSTSSYSRIMYLKFNTDIKLFGPIPYKSNKWKEICKDRTCCERINNRILNDYVLSRIRTLDSYHKVISS